MSRMNYFQADLKEVVTGSIKAMIRARLPLAASKNRQFDGWHVKRFDSSDSLKMQIVMEHRDGTERVFEVKISELKS